MRPSGSPAARQAAVFSQAVRRIQRLTSGAIALAPSVSMNSAGRQDAAFGMPPADQRLGADHRVVGQPHLRLEIELEFVFREGAPQFEIEAAARLRLRAQHRQVEAIVAAAVGFRLVERKIGVGDQLVDIGAVVRRDRDAGAAADMQDMVVDLERLGEPLEHRADQSRRSRADRRSRAGSRRTRRRPGGRPSRGCRRLRVRRWPTSTSSWSPVEWPSVSLTSLKPSRSNSAIAFGLVPPSPASRRPSSFCSVRRLGRPVS